MKKSQEPIPPPAALHVEESNCTQLTVEAGARIVAGEAVSASSKGTAHPLVAGEVFQGFAKGASLSTCCSAPPHVDVAHRGAVILSVKGVTPADAGKTVFATDARTFTTKREGSAIGKVFYCREPGKALVKFDV